MKLWMFFLFLPILHGQQSPTFADEFNGPALDLARWVPHDPFSRAAGDLSVSGGQLHLAPGGALSTFGIFAQKYGRFEIRARSTAAKGLHPRFRLMPIPLGLLPAIDVFETSGAPTRVSFANRWGSEQTERSFGDSFTVADLSAGFHILAIEWERDHIAWFVDGKEKFRSIDGVPHQPMYLLIDLPGEREGGLTFDIDYVHVYGPPDPAH
jgi:beta-glucanase (GH16 family)